MSRQQAAVDFGRGISDAWGSFASSLPRLAAFLVVLAAGWGAARVLLAVAGRALRRMGLDRAAEHGGLDRALASGRYRPADLVARLLYYAALLVVVQVAFGVFGPSPMTNLLGGAVAWLPKAAVAVVIIVVTAAVARGAKDLVNGAFGGLPYGAALAGTVSALLWGLGTVAALTQVGVATLVTVPLLVTVLATLGGVVVVGVGGGLVRPMQLRWERWLSAVERETDQLLRESAAYQRGRQDALGARLPDRTTASGTGSGRR
jgi:hypothetical protein